MTMSSAVWPPIAPDLLLKKEEESLAAELDWLLDKLQEDLGSLKAGLQQCIELLAPKDPGATLALSSSRSESVKGILTRIGTRVIKGDVQIRLATLPPPRNAQAYPLHLQNPLVLPQLTHLLTLLNQSLDIIDISRWTGDSRNGPFILGQLKLLQDIIEESRQTLKSGKGVKGYNWWEGMPEEDEDTYSPPLPQTLAPHFSVSESALVFQIRTLIPMSMPRSGNASGAATPNTNAGASDMSSWTGLSIRSRLGLLTNRLPPHDEIDQTFVYRDEEVRVKEKVRVESQDPNLIAVMAKLSALGHEVGTWRIKVGIVMGEDHEESVDDDDHEQHARQRADTARRSSR